MIFVDTNYLLRYLTDLESSQGRTANQFFLDAANGELELCSSVIVLFEVYWVLKSVYQVTELDAQNLLKGLLQMDFIEWDQKELLFEAVNAMDDFNYDLEDAFNVCFALHKKVNELASFDQKLQNKWKKITQNL